MLYKLHTNILVVGLFTIGVMAVMALSRAFGTMMYVTIAAFISQLGLLIYFSQRNSKEHNEFTLFMTVLLYSIAVGIVFMLISHAYCEDTFMFSRADATKYYSQAMKSLDIGLMNNLHDIMVNREYDDWGSYMFESIVMYIFPNKLFLNAIYMLLGALSAVYIFRIAGHYMPNMYAFNAALAYATSSFIIFFHCTFLKESLFVFLVITTFYNLYEYINTGSVGAVVRALLFGLLIVFFRPAVLAIMIASIAIYFAILQRGSAVSLFLYIGVAVVFFASFALMQSAVDSYTAGGDMDKVAEYRSNANYSSSFNYFVSYFAALFGPFPTLLSRVGSTPIAIEFYGAGLTYRQFLTIPFWLGVYFVFRSKNIGMMPVVFFVLFEMVATGYIFASLELRKVLLHMPFLYLISFYGLSRLQRLPRLRSLVQLPIYGLAIGILLLWTIIRT